MDLHRREVLLDPGLDLLVVPGEHSPGRTVAIDTVGPHGLDDLADELVAQLALTATSVQPEDDSGVDVAPHCLAVKLGEPLYGAEPLVGQPEPEHFSDLEHTDLPECHRRLPNPADRNAARVRSAAPALVDTREVVPGLAQQVVP